MQKLVRDRIPEIIRAEGKVPRTSILSSDTFRSELLKKLIEESNELADASSRTELIEELADVYEVLDTLMAADSITEEEVESVQESKRDARGGFNKRIFLESIE